MQADEFALRRRVQKWRDFRTQFHGQKAFSLREAATAEVQRIGAQRCHLFANRGRKKGVVEKLANGPTDETHQEIAKFDEQQRSSCEEFCNLAHAFYAVGRKWNAFCAFQSALSLASVSGDKRQIMYTASNLDNVRSSLVNAWHWRMLNDARRNQTFQRAISQAIERFSKTNNGRRPRLLDIGCGSGIFSIAASQLGMCDVTACELDETMAEIAGRCIQSNAADVRLIHCHSSQLECSEDELPRFDILVTETLDCGVFGEEILETLAHAHSKLLRPDIIIIPEQLLVKFALIESRDIAAEHYCRFNFSDPNISTANDDIVFISAECNLTPEYADRLFDKGDLPNASAYACDYLSELPNGYRLIGEPSAGLRFDFRNGAQLRQFVADNFASNVVLEAQTDGVVNAVAVWFRLSVYCDIELCTAPEERHCWQQAIFPIFPPRKIAAGAQLRFYIAVRNNRLLVQPLAGGPSPTRPLAVRRIGDELPPLALNLMQSVTVNKFFERCLAAVGDVTTLIDCSNLLLCARKYVHQVENDTDNSFSCIPVDLDEATTLVVSCHPAILSVIGEACDFQSVVQRLTRFDSTHSIALLHWPVDMGPTSLCCEETDTVLRLLRAVRSNNANCHLIPSIVRLKCQLVESVDLLERSRLRLSDTDEASCSKDHCGVNLSSMNDYRAHHVHELNESSLNYVPLSDAFDLLTLFIEEENFPPTVFRVTGSVTANRFGICTSVLYWFELVDKFGNEWTPRALNADHRSSEVLTAISKPWTSPSVGLCPYCPLQTVETISPDGIRKNVETETETCAKFSAFILEDYVCMAPGCFVDVTASFYHYNIIFEPPQLTISDEPRPSESVHQCEANSRATSVHNEIVRRRNDGADEDGLSRMARSLIAEMRRRDAGLRYHILDCHRTANDL